MTEAERKADLADKALTMAAAGYELIIDRVNTSQSMTEEEKKTMLKEYGDALDFFNAIRNHYMEKISHH